MSISLVRPERFRDRWISSIRDDRDGPVLELHDLHTRIRGTALHRGLNLVVRRGQTLGIIGNSGSGKSLLLKSMIGLLRPVQGSVRLFGTDLYAAPPPARQAVLRRCGVLFQHNALFSMLTVRENVAFPLRNLSGVPGRLADELAQLKISIVGLPSDAADKYPSDLSGGMEKRAGLARALATDPELLLLDEPTTGLDAIAADQIDQLIRNLARSYDITVVLVTHDIDTLMGVCDRVAGLVDGRIVALSSPRDLYDSPHPWVHRFLTARPHRRP